MASDSIKEEIDKIMEGIGKSYTESRDEFALKLKNDFDDYHKSLKDSTCTASSRVFGMYDGSLENISDTLHLQEFWKFRNQFIADYSLAQRINMILLGNLTVFLFSRGLRRIRNPILFSTFASLFVLPEIINPFNRR